MGGIYNPPTFTAPPQAPIVVGSVGQVLTVTAANVVAFAGAGTGGIFLGTYLAPTALAAGETDNYSPTGFTTAINRLDLTPGSGNSNITGLIAGGDGQLILGANIGVDLLTLNNQNASSTAINRFRGANDLNVAPGQAFWLCYYGGSVNRWVMGLLG